MLTTFIAVLSPMLSLFICIAIGFALFKGKILNKEAGTAIAKLETWVFCPALSFVTMARYCTAENLFNNLQLILISSAVVLVAVLIAITLSPSFVKEKSTERGIYQYALTFANFGFLGDPLILAVFGEEMLFLYKLFTFPMYVVIYTWGLNIIIPSNANTSRLGKLLTPPFIAMCLGIVVGLFGLGNYLPDFVGGTLDMLKVCMGPLAMILCGITIARFDIKEMLTDKKVYVATLFRMLVIPAFFIFILFAVKAVLISAFNFDIGTDVFFLIAVAYAGPLGLNTVVFPEAYGGNPKTGASMAMISNPIAVITLPIVFAILSAILGVEIL